MRIASLSPAVSETLSLLGLEDEIVGITPWCKTYLKNCDKTTIGTYLEVNLSLLKELKPDVVFLQAHVHDRVFPQLKSAGFNAHLIPLPTNLLDIASNVEYVASVVGRYWEGKELADRLAEAVLNVKRGSSPSIRPKVYVEFLWPDGTFSTTGCLTYVDDGIRIAGGVNVFHSRLAKFFQPNDSEVVALDPEVILVSIEPQLGRITASEYMDMRRSLANTTAFKLNAVYLIVESAEANLAHPGPSFITSTLRRLSQIMRSRGLRG